MAASSSAEDDLNLKEVFQRGLDLHRKVESSDEPGSSKSLQKQISSSIEYFRKATEMVNTLALFSTNEILDEVATTNLRYFMLPALLGDLTLRQMSDDRCSNVKMSKIYFLDFLKRCQDYGVIKQDVLHNVVTANLQSNSATRSLQQQAVSREEKIRRYKEQKQQENRLKELQAHVEGKVSSSSSQEEIQREYYILLLRLWVNKSVEHLASTEEELQILEHMGKLRAGQVPEVPPEKQRKPRKPILITREMLQSKVFGAGYPSLPTMSQEEYLEKEIREGKVVLEYDKNTPGTSKDEEEEEDKSDDEDSPEKLQKARAWDEWRDEHRRGEGNRDNMG